MADRFELLTLADNITTTADLDKDKVFGYVDKLYRNIEKLSIGDRECVSSACKKVIEWLSKQDSGELERQDWYSIVRKLCTTEKDYHEEGFDTDAQTDISQEIHRANVNLLVDTNIVLRVIEMCFSEKEPFFNDGKWESNIDFKSWYGRISLMCSFLACGWERLNIEQANALRYSASTILRMIPAISAESEKIFIRSILRVINRIVHLVAGYEGHEEFSKSFLALYREVIAKTPDFRDEEHVVTSLIMNLDGLTGSENSQETMELLWEMLLKMCTRLRDGEGEATKEKKHPSPSADFHKSLDQWLSSFIQATIQDSLEEKNFKREEVCNWIISTLTVSSYKIQPIFADFETVLRTCILVTGDQSPSLCSSLSRLYTKLMQDGAYTLEQQNQLIDTIFELWNTANESSALILLKKIFEGDSTHSLLVRSANRIIEEDAFSDKKLYLVLEDCVGHMENNVKNELARKVVDKINEMSKDEASEEKLVNSLRHLNILLERKMDDGGVLESRKDEKRARSEVPDLSHFNDLLNTKEYTRMLGVCMEVIFGSESKREGADSIFLPPVNTEYVQRIVNGEKLLSYHHIHYFLIHAYLSKSNEYKNYLIAINGGPQIEPLLTALCSQTIMDGMIQSMLKIMLSTREMFPLQLSSRYNSSLGYIVDSMRDGTLQHLSPATLKLVTQTITSVELRYALYEFSRHTSEREGARSRMLKLIQIAKCSLITEEERSRLLEVVKMDIQKAIFSILMAYNDSSIPIDPLLIQHKLIAILRRHVGMEGLHPSTVSYMDLYLPDLRLSNSSHSFECLLSLLMSALCDSPTLKYPMETGTNHFGKEPLSPYITTPLMDRFTRLLLSLFSITESKFLPPIEWSSVSKKHIAYWLDSVGDMSGGIATSLPLIVFLSKVIQGENMREETRSIVMDYVNKKGPSFVLRVMRASPCKPVFFHALTPIIEYLRTRSELSSEVDGMLVECVPLLFSDPVNEMVQFFPVLLQATDRYAQTQLHWRSLGFPVGDEEGQQEVVDPIFASFNLLSQLSTFKRLIFTMMETLGERLQEWLSDLDDDTMVLRGVTITPTTQVIWKVQLISQAFAYISCVADEVRKRDETEGIEEESDSDDGEQEEKLLMLERLEAEEDLIKCTFVNTSKEFTKQHWYNCYTCNMVDSEGVCTVCALNCHRGHDISYSKLGAFFCDCGAKMCPAMSGARNKPANRRMKRMKRAKREEKWTPLVNVPEDMSKEEVEKYLKTTQQVLTMHSKSLNDLILGIEVAYEGKFNIESRRQRAMRSMEKPVFKYDECVMVGKLVENEGLEQLDRTSDSVERNMTKECSEIVRLRDGSALLLHVNEQSTHLSLVYMGVPSAGGEIGDTRVEREPLPFAPRRIAVKDEFIAITGIDEVAFLRVSLNSGDIIQKEVIRIKDANAANPILKAVWSVDGDEKESVTLAVACTTSVRIYNVFKDPENHELELVLPLGSVIDLTFVKKQGADYMWIVILSSPSHLYYHQLGGPGPEVFDDTKSIYLTNTLPLPVQTTAVSLHFSQVTRMLYISFQSDLYCAHVKDGDVMNIVDGVFHKLDVGGSEPWVGWTESDGMVAAIAHPSPPNRVIFIYPTLNEMLIQVAPLPQSAHSISLAPSTSFDSVMGLVLLSGYRKPAMLFTSNWLNQPDLWMEHRSMKMDKIAMIEEEDGLQCSHEESVTLFETCSEVKEVEYTSKELEEFYSSGDLTTRLKMPENMPVISLNREDVNITIRVSKRHFEVKGLRLEVEGSSGPKSITYNGKKISLKRKMKSTYDIVLLPGETINSERDLTVRLECNQGGPTIIVSLRCFGDSREDLYARCLTFPSLSLPYQCVLHALKMIYELWEYDLFLPTHVASEDEGESREWIRESCLLVVTPRSCRPTLTAMGKKLLKRYWRGERNKYHEFKDRELIASFAKYGGSSDHVPSPVLASYLSALRQMIEKRYENIVKYADLFFGDVVNMSLLLHREMEWMNGEDSTQTLLVSVYLQLTCSLLSNGHEMSKQVMAQLIEVITDHKTRKMWRRLREELRRIVKESLDGTGLKSGDWTEKLVDIMTHSIVDEMRIEALPVWWKGGVDKEEKIDLPFQRALMGMNSLVEVTTTLLKEFPKEKAGKILASVVDRMDTLSVMREEDEVRVKNVRIGGVISLIGGVCKGGEKKKEVERVPSVPKEEEKKKKKSHKRETEIKEYSALEEDMPKICVEIVKPLLEDETRKEKLLYWNFRLMEESLKFMSSFKDIQRVDSGWNIHGGTGGMSTSECLLEYYMRVGRCTLRLPLLFLLPQPSVRLGEDRKKIICEMVMVDERISLKKEAQQLLYQACGCDEKKTAETKNEYVMMRNLDILKFEYLPKLTYSHEDSTAIIEIIGRIREIASETSECWRRVCEANLRWILLLTSKVSEPVGVTMLELIQSALKIRKDDDVKESRSSQSRSSQPPPSPFVHCSIADTALECTQTRNVLKVLIIKYLLGREEARRWLMHAVCRSLMQLARRKNQIELANMLFYEVLPMGRRLGERGAQLGDLCSAYLPTLLPPSTLLTMAEEELTNLDALLTKLERSEQKGAADWLVDAGMGWREALYLSPDPCVQCLRPNETMEIFKLSAIKGEAKFTTNALMYKLNGHYEICKVIIKLADVKKSRSIRRITLYCTWKAIENAIDLKSNRDMWKEVASAQVSATDVEVTLTVAIPIVTNGLVIEMSEVNDTRGSSEVHCPRCSSLVRPTPGVCDNCGENVYQCVKCRAINYDEKEPFLCSACGHCKYARIDVSVVGRGQPTMVISADKDKPMAWRASKSMNKLQWEMDTNRSQLRINALLAQSLTIGHNPIPASSFPVEARVVSDPSYPHVAQIGPNDPRSLALNECMKRIREASESLRSQSLQLLSIREAMRKMDQVYNASTSLQFYNASDGGCIGCLVSSIIHSVSLLRSLSTHANISATILSHSNLIYNRLVKESGSIDTLRDELESLMIRLCDREDGVDRLCEVVRDRRIPTAALARSLLTLKSVRWSERLETLLECAMSREEDDEAQIALIHVLLDSMREAKSVLRMMEERKRTKRLMGEKGPSTSTEKKPEKKEEAWTIIDAILNSHKEVEVDDIEKERSRCKDVDKLLWRLVFSRSIFVRSLAGRLIRAMMSVPGQAGAVVSLCLLGLSHARLNEDASRCDQFFLAFNCLIERGQIKLRLFQANFHLHLMGVILSESHRLSNWERGDQSVSHSSGVFVFHCTNLLSNVLAGPLFVASSRDSLLVPLLHSCILLRRVTIKRNRAIARALFQLENLLRKCTAQEGLSLLTAAVACLSQVKDEKSRADVVGVILETLDPREKQSDEFLMQVEKDAAQEDFLQGRMQQNPYKSGDASMGPLMRDIKDKICRESELIAFLDDDNGMELLVNGKIISLSLPVKLVYDAIWKPFHPGEPMVIVYRMRGLMGDAVEPFVENIDDKTEGECVGEEETRLLKAFLACGGVSTTLTLLSKCSLSPNGCLLLVQLRKLLVHLLRVDNIKRELINEGGVSVLLGLVQRVRTQGQSSDDSMVAAEIDLLRMMNSLVSDGNHHPILRGMSAEECEWLFSLLEEEEGGTEKRDRPHSELVLQVTKILGNGVLGSDTSEKMLVTRLKEGLNWEDLLNEKTDNSDHTYGRRRRQNVMDDVERRADSFTLIVDGILATEKGMALKEQLINAGLIDDAVKALLYMHPPLYGTVESPEWKTYLARPALKLVLRLLKGMAKGDEKSQVEIAKKALPMLHRLEQVSSAEHLGTLAENVMEALSQNKEVATQIDDVRDETKKKKRQMAMAMREKQLSKLGMRMGRKGEVTVSSRSIVNEPELGEASDPLTSCCICRESILTGSRVAATYALAIPYRTQDSVPTHCSLSLSVMVHVDCHYNAIRRSNGGRNTDEWTKAALHNSGARCNMVVPIPVAEPSTSDWNSAISRMEGDLEGVVSGGGPITRHRVFKDMCNLIRKFVLNRSFSESAGGGGRESNMQYLGVLHLLALHLPEGDLPCSMASERLNSFLLTELTVADWNGERMDVLRAFLRDISIADARGVARESLLRESLLQWTFVDLYFNRVIPVEGDDRFKWLQSHFGETLKKTSELVKYFDTTLLPVKKNEDLAKIIGVDMDDALSLSTVTTPT